jgi:protein SCO1
MWCWLPGTPPRAASAVRTTAAVALLVVSTLAGCATTGGGGVQRGEDVEVPRVSLFAHPWVWTDEQGQSVSFARWQGEPLVVTAMFTSCKATCPRTIAKLQQLYAAYQREGRAAQFVLVTLDPENDTPQRLREFKQAGGLPPAWHFLVGGERETHEIVEALDVHIIDDGPHLLHDGRIIVFDAQGMPARSFSGWGLDHEVVLSSRAAKEAAGPQERAGQRF